MFNVNNCSEIKMFIYKLLSYKLIMNLFINI